MISHFAVRTGDNRLLVVPTSNLSMVEITTATGLSGLRCEGGSILLRTGSSDHLRIQISGPDVLRLLTAIQLDNALSVPPEMSGLGGEEPDEGTGHA